MRLLLKKSIPAILITFFLVSFFNPSYAIQQKTSASLQYDVIIVGAGISGLSAAQNLIKHHNKILVLEARNRVGGRIWSKHSWGATIDLGASWIHGVENNPITKIVTQHRIKTVPTTYRDAEISRKFSVIDLYDSDGKKFSRAQVQHFINQLEAFDDYLDKLHKTLKKDISYAQALKRFVKLHNIKGKDLRVFRFIVSSAYEYEYAASLNKLSVKSTFNVKSLVSGDNVVFPKGYIQIIAQLAKNVPILLNHKVTKIIYDKNGVTVIANHKNFKSRFVIVTVSLGVLKSGSIKFSPLLPTAKQKAINVLQMGVYNKIFLLFNQVFWDKKAEWIGMVPKANSPDQWVDIMNYYTFTKQPILLVFTAASFAKRIETWPDKKIISRIMQVLHTIYGKNIPEPSSYVITRWYQDPYARGSYSYLPVGTKVKDYANISTPVMNRLFFAGEATSTSDPSTVHGAYFSGVHAAQRAYQSGMRAAKQIEKLKSHNRG